MTIMLQWKCKHVVHKENKPHLRLSVFYKNHQREKRRIKKSLVFIVLLLVLTFLPFRFTNAVTKNWDRTVSFNPSDPANIQLLVLSHEYMDGFEHCFEFGELKSKNGIINLSDVLEGSFFNDTRFYMDELNYPEGVITQKDIWLTNCNNKGFINAALSLWGLDKPSKTS